MSISNKDQQIDQYDAVVVGSGPNGLAAAITLAQQGLRVHIIEGHSEVGGGMRTSELTLPGFQHDVCSTAHPMAMLSPFLKSLPLDQHGLEWVLPEIPVAHIVDKDEAVFLYQSIDETAKELGKDERAYKRYFTKLSDKIDAVAQDILRPINPLPKDPISFLRFGIRAMLPASLGTRLFFKTKKGRALFAGNAAHSILPLNQLFTSAVAVSLMAGAHKVGWPFAKGGSVSIANAMLSYFESLGGTYKTGKWINQMDDLPSSKAYLFDLNPAQLVKISGTSLPKRYKERLMNFKHGAGVYKLDIALDGPIPWKNKKLQKAGTIHLGGDLDEIENSEALCWQTNRSLEPFILLTQPTLFDKTRAPESKHIVWLYCHTRPHEKTDLRDQLIEKIETHAPGFKSLILETNTMTPTDFENYNPNYVGGDIIGGSQEWRQLFTRPLLQKNPYETKNPKIFLCSSSTPPGGGVHGMCGYWCGVRVLQKVFRISKPLLTSKD